jgi:hypothetical protein
MRIDARRNQMQRTRMALVLAMFMALMTVGPVLAQDSTPGAQQGSRPVQSMDADASPAAEDEPQIDLVEFGAWGVASRDFEQTGEDLDHALIFSSSVAAFPDEETAQEAFPSVVEAMLALPQNEQLEEVEVEEIADEQIFLYGEIESNGYTFNLGMLVVRNGAFLSLAGGLSFETLDIQDDLVSLSSFLQDQIEGETPETGDDLLAMLPEPDDLPGADKIGDPYEITRERVRLAE